MKIFDRKSYGKNAKSKLEKIQEIIQEEMIISSFKKLFVQIAIKQWPVKL